MLPPPILFEFLLPTQSIVSGNPTYSLLRVEASLCSWLGLERMGDKLKEYG